MTAPFGEQLPASWLVSDWPRNCPWCGGTVPVGVPMRLVDGDLVCDECAQ